jgi:hypothetical protein
VCKHETELWINRWFYTSNNPARSRSGYDEGNPSGVTSLDVDRFKIFCQKYSEENWQNKEGISSSYPSLKYVTDASQPSLEEVARFGENLILCGFWSHQTDYLFEEQFVDLIRIELTPICRIEDERFQLIKGKIENCPDSVAVHVRRGDYKHLQHIFALLPEDYYERAFDLMDSKLRTPEYFVFSEKLTWCDAIFAFREMCTS